MLLDQSLHLLSTLALLTRSSLTQLPVHPVLLVRRVRWLLLNWLNPLWHHCSRY
jgi:hypothetical protein